MADQNQQTFANHTRLDPTFHPILPPIFAINFILAVVHLVREPSLGAAWQAVFAAALLLAIFKMRLYSLKVQDRIIRLEERLRLSGLLQEPLRSRIPELTEKQLIALRFASDAELPALVEKTLANNLPQKEIKLAVKMWRPDFFRV